MRFMGAVSEWWAAYWKSRVPLHLEFRLRSEMGDLPIARLPLPRGTKVVTTQANAAVTDWSSAAAASRRWGVSGEVVVHHNAHGPSYEVRHDVDGTIGHYHPAEIAVA